jgi:hypothetical protein
MLSPGYVYYYAESYFTLADGVGEEDIYEAIGGAGSYDANIRIRDLDSHTTDDAYELSTDFTTNTPGIIYGSYCQGAQDIFDCSHPIVTRHTTAGI